MIAMPFGRYRGQPLRSVPTDYLYYVLGWDELWDSTRAAIEAELRIREEAERQRRASSGPAGQVLDPDTAEAALRIVREGYRLAALESHPDRGGDTEEMKAVNGAAEALRRWLERVSPPQAGRRSA